MYATIQNAVWDLLYAQNSIARLPYSCHHLIHHTNLERKEAGFAGRGSLRTPEPLMCPPGVLDHLCENNIITVHIGKVKLPCIVAISAWETSQLKYSSTFMVMDIK